MKRSKRSRKMNREIGNMTANRMNLEKPMDMETIKRINANLLAMAQGQNGSCREPAELKDWQREIMKG